MSSGKSALDLHPFSCPGMSAIGLRICVSKLLGRLIPLNRCLQTFSCIFHESPLPTEVCARPALCLFKCRDRVYLSPLHQPKLTPFAHGVVSDFRRQNCVQSLTRTPPFIFTFWRLRNDQLAACTDQQRLKTVKRTIRLTRTMSRSSSDSLSQALAPLGFPHP